MTSKCAAVADLLFDLSRQSLWGTVARSDSAVALDRSPWWGKLPQEYRDFVVRPDLCVTGGTELFGVTAGARSLDEANQPGGLWPNGIADGLICFGSAGSGDVYYFFRGESVWEAMWPSHDFDESELEPTADDWLAFLSRWLEARLASEAGACRSLEAKPSAYIQRRLREAGLMTAKRDVSAARLAETIQTRLSVIKAIETKLQTLMQS